MDQIENHKLQILRRFIRSQFLRKFTKLLLSLSVFSLFFSHSSRISMLHSFNFYFHTLPFKLISHNIDKNCIFLLCNGLLVFLAKYSGLICSSSKHNHADESFKGYEDVQQSETPAMDQSQVPLLENEVVVETENGSLIETEGEYIIEEVAERETKKFLVMEAEETKERKGGRGDLIIDGEQEDEDDENGDFFEEEVKEMEGTYTTVQEVEEEEEEEEREEGNGLLSTEELNKKFDEFIRKMKEELRVEARQQLIMV